MKTLPDLSELLCPVLCQKSKPKQKRKQPEADLISLNLLVYTGQETNVSF